MKQKKTTTASGRKYGASFVRALKERSMLDPDAPNAIVFTSDCCYETHSPREACKKEEPGKHLRMEAVVSQLGGETSHLDDGNVPIQTEDCSKKSVVFPTEQLSDIDLQDEIDTFDHVCRYLKEQGRPDGDLLARLEKLEAEQRGRK